MLLFTLKGEMGRGAKLKKKLDTRLADFRDGRDENNLAEFPLALLADRVPEGQKSVEYQDTITDWKTGQVVHRRVCITGSDKFGLPTSKDEDVLLALVQLTKIRNDFSSSEVFFTKHQVIEVLGWQNRGWAYERVEESLHRWKGVSVHYWNAWRDNAKETWNDSEAIGILEYVRISDGRRTKGGRTNHADGGSQIVWNKMFFESFRAGYLKKLDFQTYRSLKRPAARRAYRFLDKRFHHSDVWEFDLRVFACEKLGFSRGYDTGQLKERVQPALDELVAVGFMESPRYEKQAPGVWKIHVRRTDPVDRSVPGVGACDITRVLMARGIGASIAARLAKDYSREQIEEKVRFFDALICKNDSRALQNPAGFLVSAIRDDYAVAKGRLGPGANRKPGNTKGRVSSAPSEPVTVSTISAGKPGDVDDVTRLRAYEQEMTAEHRVELEKRALAEATAFEHRTLERLQATNPVLWAQLRDKLVMACLERDGICL
ncbi:MAG: replication initiator protein A [Pirellulales bacterium]|nr:replication initiator protein A [Pirellulales bacterium]